MVVPWVSDTGSQYHHIVARFYIEERFDEKDLEVHFRELAQLKQTGSADAFISEFQRITIHDEDVHEEIALEPSCETSDTSTSDSQIVDKPCDELELVHSS